MKLKSLRLVLLKNKTVPEDAYERSFVRDGHIAHFIPLLNHSPVNIMQTVQFLRSERFHAAPAFIITSQRAVEVFHECLRLVTTEDPEMARRIRNKCGYTVGPATFEVLKENGFQNVRGGCEAGNGAKLADIILQDRERQISPFDAGDEGEIVFFTGEIRKDIIPVKLCNNGVSVHETVIYKTEPKSTILADYVTALERPISWLIFFSPQATETIVAHLVSEGIPNGTKVACIGPTTQEYLVQRGIVPHVTAAKPTAQSLLDGISQWEAST